MMHRVLGLYPDLICPNHPRQKATCSSPRKEFLRILGIKVPQLCNPRHPIPHAYQFPKSKISFLKLRVPDSKARLQRNLEVVDNDTPPSSTIIISRCSTWAIRHGSQQQRQWLINTEAFEDHD